MGFLDSLNPANVVKKLTKQDKVGKYLGDPGAYYRAGEQKKKAAELVNQQQAEAATARQNMMAQNLAQNMKIDLGLDNVANVVAGGEAEAVARAYTDEKRGRKRSSATQLSSVLGIRL